MDKVSQMDRSMFNGMNTSKAARYCGVSEGLLRKMRQNGDGPRYCKIGAKVVYRKTDLDEYLDGCLVQ